MKLRSEDLKIDGYAEIEFASNIDNVAVETEVNDVTVNTVNQARGFIKVKVMK